MLEIVLTSSESDQYSSAPKEISKFPLMYMTAYLCRSVYNLQIRVHKMKTALKMSENKHRENHTRIIALERSVI